MDFRLGEQINWKDIKVGEIVAAEGCITIAEKRSKDSALILATTQERSDYGKNCKEKFIKEGGELYQNEVGKIAQLELEDECQFREIFLLNGLAAFSLYALNPQDNKTQSTFYKLPLEVQELWGKK